MLKFRGIVCDLSIKIVKIDDYAEIQLCDVWSGGHQETDDDINSEVDLIMSSDIVAASLSTKHVTFNRLRSGWLFREDKTVSRRTVIFVIFMYVLIVTANLSSLLFSVWLCFVRFQLQAVELYNKGTANWQRKLDCLKLRTRSHAGDINAKRCGEMGRDGMGMFRNGALTLPIMNASRYV